MTSRAFLAVAALHLALLPLAGHAGVVRTSEASESGSVRITQPEDGATLPATEPLRVEYEANPGFKGRYVQLQLNEQKPVVLDELKGGYDFSDIEPGRYTIRAELLNPAHADLGIGHSVTVTVESATDKEGMP